LQCRITKNASSYSSTSSVIDGLEVFVNGFTHGKMFLKKTIELDRWDLPSFPAPVIISATVNYVFS
jgi:hypothetical protein